MNQTEPHVLGLELARHFMAGQNQEKVPDLAQGVALDVIPDGGLLAGTVGDEPVILTRNGEVVRAFGGTCTHLGAPLSDGIVVGGAVRCPWHHACFDLASGRASAAPAFDPLPVWEVEQRGTMVAVKGKGGPMRRPLARTGGDAPPIVIIGGGAGGYAAAHELRDRGFGATITLVSDEPHAPYDRTLLTKDYLDGKFGDDHLPIAEASLADLGVTLLGGTRATAIDRAAYVVALADGRTLPYGKLLVATGAEPTQLDVPGADLRHVTPLRSLDDCRRLLANMASSKRVVVIGSSFIGLEAAASIRSRGFDVTVVTPEAAPMAKTIGPDLSRAIVDVHRAQGVDFRLNTNLKSIQQAAVLLEDGSSVAADVVVVGIGVKPRTELATSAGLLVDKGVIVDATLRTSDPDIFAIGDIARWPDPRAGTPIRVEHWVVAQRQGQHAARNMMGGCERYQDVPFFWSKHFDFSFRYVGHADAWDTIDIEGDLTLREAVLRFRKDGRVLAVATVGNDKAALEVEREMESEHTA